MQKTVYNVAYLNKKGELIDDTQIDEKNKKLAWDLFKEFGHKRKKGDRIEFEDTTEDE